MDVEERKNIVANLLSSANQEAAKEAQLIKAEPNAGREFLYEHLRNFVLSKYLLPPDCEETDLKELATLSLARTMKLDKEMIRSLDQATPCDHATSESTKKVLLLYAVQTDLCLPPNPEKIGRLSNLSELTDYVYQALRKE